MTSGVCFESAFALHIKRPGEAELRDIVLIDLCQRTEARFAVVAAVSQPVGTVIACSQQAL